MNNFRRYFNRNRKSIWGIIIIIFFFIIILQLFNFIVKNINEKKKEDFNNMISKEVNNDNNVTNKKSLVSGEKVNTERLNNDTKLIKQFLDYCNNNEIENAYNLLSDSCKKEMYNNINDFSKFYYDTNFNGNKKTYSIENWSDNIYKVKIIEDILSTGKSNNGESKHDYITIIKQDNQFKLNINNYIGFKEINKTTTEKDVTINIISKNVYMDYEEYNIKVVNNTKKTILLDEGKKIDSISVEDQNKGRHSAYTHELTEQKLIVNPLHTNNIKIKFYNGYSSNKSMEYLVFSDIVLDYDLYKQALNTDMYRDIIEIRARL